MVKRSTRLRKKIRGLDKQAFRHGMLIKTEKPAKGELTISYWNKEKEMLGKQSSCARKLLKKKRKKK